MAARSVLAGALRHSSAHSVPRRIGPRYPVGVRPSLGEMLAAALLVAVLSGLVVLIVLATIPVGGPPALR